MRTNPAVPLLSIALVAGACGGGETTPKATPDVVTLVVNGVSATYDDTASDVTITAASNTSAGMNVDLYATGLTVWIRLNAPLPASLPATVTGSLTYIAGGSTFSSSSVSYSVTQLSGSMGGTVEGSFPTTALSGPTTIQVSGSFKATRIN